MFVPEGRDQQIAAPAGEHGPVIDGHAARGDRRVPVVGGLFGAFTGRDPFIDRGTAIFDPIGHLRPAVVQAGPVQIDLVAAARAVLDGPDVAVRRYGDPLRIAVT